MRAVPVAWASDARRGLPPLADLLTALAAVACVAGTADTEFWLAVPLVAWLPRTIDALSMRRVAPDAVIAPDPRQPDWRAAADGLAAATHAAIAQGRSWRVRLCAVWRSLTEAQPYALDFDPQRRELRLSAEAVRQTRGLPGLPRPHVALPLLVTVDNVDLEVAPGPAGELHVRRVQHGRAATSLPLAAAVALAACGLDWRLGRVVAVASAALLLAPLGGRNEVVVCWPWRSRTLRGRGFWDTERSSFHWVRVWLSALVLTSCAASGTVFARWASDPLRVLAYAVLLPAGLLRLAQHAVAARRRRR